MPPERGTALRVDEPSSPSAVAGVEPSTEMSLKSAVGSGALHADAAMNNTAANGAMYAAGVRNASCIIRRILFSQPCFPV